ncbi:MAG: isoleucine--tRNA ligase, partial [Candidatus Nanoarchaeia archaeon]
MIYDPQKVEKEVIKYWAKNNVHQLLKKKRAKAERFFLLDGPPYATGDPHPGTAINRGLKDLVRRYKWMAGYNVWDQPGFDMHGLPIENMVEQKLGLKNKEEIINYGVRKFVNECRKYAFQYLGVMGKMFSRLGEWADWEHPYETTNNNYIEGVWWALKKAWDRKALYEGERVLSWCPHCGTALAANYEIDYKKLKESSIYVKFKLREEPDAYLVIWTTTPWTLSSNMAVMANPDIIYARVKVGAETWLMAKELVDKVMKLADKDYKIIKEFKGSELKGLSYTQPFIDEMPFHQEPHGVNAYTVVLSKDYVNLQEGSGLVHCAPGCGPEDQLVGNENKIPSFNPIDENGVFGADGGKFKGLRAKIDDNTFTETLASKSSLVAVERIEHDYPHCERCKSPVVFKNTKQWFIKVTKFKDKMISENKKVNWVPKWAGENQFNKWLESIRDWCITRQRFWGVPLPIWQCDKCHKFEVIGSLSELKKLAGVVPADLHKPGIDAVKWRCTCGGEFNRNPDIIDVWIDSACAPFASLPLPREQWMSKLGKMNFTIEAKDQIRGWFYSLMGIGVVSFDRCPYTNIFMHAFLTDESGQKLSKRKGNYLSLPEIFNQVGADVFRTSLMSSLTPGVDSKFIMDEVKNSHKTLNVIWNTHEYLLRNIKYYKVTPSKPIPVKKEDEWLLSKLNSLIVNCDKIMTSYHLEDYAPSVINFLVEDLSRYYIKLIRNRLDAGVVNLIYYAFTNAIKLLGPVAPHISEKIYQNLSASSNSLFLDSLPLADNKLINQD